ncbi:hypothetical protein JCM10212_003639 [Sporobolomyces blumeae]
MLALPALLLGCLASTSLAVPAERALVDHDAPTTALVERRSTGRIPAPKAMVVATSPNERQFWVEPEQLQVNLTFSTTSTPSSSNLSSSPSSSSATPNTTMTILPATCDRGLDTCLVTTGETDSDVNRTLHALLASPMFDLTRTYWLIATVTSNDSLTMSLLSNASQAGIVDYNRVIVLRSEFELAMPANASSYATEPLPLSPGERIAACENLQTVGSAIIDDIVSNWNTLYANATSSSSTSNETAPSGVDGPSPLTNSSIPSSESEMASGGGGSDGTTYDPMPLPL